MVSEELLDQVADQVRGHCAAKGYVSGPNWNPMAPQDSVAAFAMAKRLVQSQLFDHYLAVAPEGHVYGYFFECFKAAMLSAFVPYPPTHVDSDDDLAVINGGRVLILEDDVVSGTTLRLIVAELAKHSPSSMSLYIGREKDYQQLQNVPSAITKIYFAEDHLDPAQREHDEAEFDDFFGKIA